MIAHVAFVRPIWILGTSKREDQFRAVDGWEIAARGLGISLRHPGAQNVPAVPAFEVHGVGYSMTARDFAAEPELVPPYVVSVPPPPEPVTYVRKGKR